MDLPYRNYCPFSERLHLKLHTDSGQNLPSFTLRTTNEEKIGAIQFFQMYVWYVITLLVNTGAKLAPNSTKDIKFKELNGKIYLT